MDLWPSYILIIIVNIEKGFNRNFLLEREGGGAIFRVFIKKKNTLKVRIYSWIWKSIYLYLRTYSQNNRSFWQFYSTRQIIAYMKINIELESCLFWLLPYAYKNLLRCTKTKQKSYISYMMLILIKKHRNYR